MTRRARATVLAYRAAMTLSGRVPPAVAYPVLDRVADLVRLAAPAERRAVEANLAQVLGGSSRRHAWAVRGVFRHALWNYYDTFRLPALGDGAVRGFVVIDGLEHLRDALALGRGAILVSAHVSSVAFAVQALALALDGHAGMVAVEAVEPPELLDVLLRARSSHVWRYRALGPGLAGELAAALRRNEVVCLVADRDIGGAGTVLDFFGRPARLPTGPALLALRTGAPIVPAAVSRRRDGRLDGRIGPPLHSARTEHWRADVADITRRITAHLEYHIGRFPEQWTVLQRIWEHEGRSGRQAPSST
jgi:lauroyl/myristoyl acyltransferase